MRLRLAFTLVEILVVLAIVALLATLIFAVFSSARESGRRTTCVSNQKQILLALQLYQEDAAGHFPFQHGLPIYESPWIDSLLIYTKTSAVFRCPSDADIEKIKDSGRVTFDDGSKHPAIATNYLANEVLLSGRAPGPGYRIGARTLNSVINPASTVFLCDGVKTAFPRPPYWTDKAKLNPIAGTALIGYILRDPLGSHADGSYAEPFAPNPRHNGRAVVGFVDGHVQTLDLSKWYFPDTPYLDPSRGG